MTQVGWRERRRRSASRTAPVGRTAKPAASRSTPRQRPHRDRGRRQSAAHRLGRRASTIASRALRSTPRVVSSATTSIRRQTLDRHLAEARARRRSPPSNPSASPAEVANARVRYSPDCAARRHEQRFGAPPAAKRRQIECRPPPARPDRRSRRAALPVFGGARRLESRPRREPGTVYGACATSRPSSVARTVPVRRASRCCERRDEPVVFHRDRRHGDVRPAGPTSRASNCQPAGTAAFLPPSPLRCRSVTMTRRPAPRRRGRPPCRIPARSASRRSRARVPQRRPRLGGAAGLRENVRARVEGDDRDPLSAGGPRRSPRARESERARRNEPRRSCCRTDRSRSTRNVDRRGALHVGPGECCRQQQQRDDARGEQHEIAKAAPLGDVRPATGAAAAPR